jgi:hypothetical protein
VNGSGNGSAVGDGFTARKVTKPFEAGAPQVCLGETCYLLTITQ